MNKSQIEVYGAREHNLKNIDVEIPRGTLTVITGLSGSGKSTLVNETLRPILSRVLYRSLDRPLEYDSVEGIENIDKQKGYGNDPLNQRGTVGWKATHVAKRLVESYMIRIESACPDSFYGSVPANGQ